MIVIGHRGAAGYEPENTLRSIACAIELGADWVEIDVQSVENRLVVLHDDYLDRTTDGSGPLDRIDFETLRTLDAGKGERVPLLAEVIEHIDARVGLNIEIKGTGLVPAIKDLVHESIARQPAWRGRFLLSSFHEEQTEQLAPNDGEFLIGALFTEDATAALERAVRLGAWSINPSLMQVSEELIRAAHARGLKVIVYTVNEPADIRAMHALGIDGVFSDYPDRVHALCGD